MRASLLRSLPWVILSCLFTGLAFSLPAGKSISEYDRRVWQTQDGLPEDTVQSLAETEDGYLWIGTREGLARFDGFRFVVFDQSNTPAFRDDSVLALDATKGDVLWIGTEGGGLVRYHDGRFRAFSAEQGLTDGFVRAIYQDHRGRLLVGTDHGLFRLSGSRFVRMDGRGGLPYLSVHAITEDSQGRLWVGGSGLYILDHGTAKRILLDESTASSQIKSILIAKNGSVWVGTYAGLYRLKDGVIRHYPFNRDIEANICQDGSGNIWLGWVGDGLSRFQDGQWVTYRAPGVLPNNTVLSIFEDSDQDLWVGTENGLLRISDTGVSVLENKDGVALGNSSTIYENVSTIYHAPDGRLWIANGHLYQIDRWRLIRFKLPPAARRVEVRTVFKDRKGVLWLGTGGQGLVAIRNGAVMTYTTRQGLVNDFIRAFCEDRKGNLWIGTDGGVSVWNGKRFRNFDASNGLVYPSVRTIVQTKDGDLWIGTDGGINVVTDGRLTTRPPLARLLGDRIWCIHQDSQGDLWIGTRGDGLIRLKGGKLAHYTTRCGLPDDNIYQILEDRRGNLWFSGRAGIFQIPLADLNRDAGCSARSLGATVYVTPESAEAGEVNGGVQPAGSAGSSGDLWFPTTKGAVRIEPDEVRAARPRDVIIEQVIADGREIPVRSSVRIRPGDGKLEIHYTSPALIEPEQIRFKYRLDGFDKQWVYAGTARAAYYTNLPPGNYRFEVAAFAGHSPTDPAEADFPFVWEAHYYQTAWFDVVCILIAGCCCWAAFWMYGRQTKARYALLAEERGRLAREMHDTVIQGCVGVSTLLEAVSISTTHEASTDLLDRARMQVRLTLEEARQAVWDLRQPSINASLPTTLVELTGRLCVDKRVPIETEISGDEKTVDSAVARSLLLVAREALLNAIAHGRPQKITVYLRFEAAEVSIEIFDDGCGFEPPGELVTGDGHWGLVGMRERVEQLRGRFSLSSAAGGGTRVFASLPLVSPRRI